MLLIRFMMVMTLINQLDQRCTKGDWWKRRCSRSPYCWLNAGNAADDYRPCWRGRSNSQTKVIVKHLDAIQNFGAMDILCTDKTGTWTQDKIVLENHTDIAENEGDGSQRLAEQPLSDRFEKSSDAGAGRGGRGVCPHALRSLAEGG